MSFLPLLQNIPPLPPKFDGETFIEGWDADRLTGQWRRVWATMSDQEWRTLSQIREQINYWYDGQWDSEAAISARLRDFRKAKFGGHTVERRRRGDPKSGLFEYRLLVNK